ncbi:hypothetical protein GCU60_01565 [Blastococcus saxobsidens]|uniref:Uncharacterized protein n=1 Tax=Blastococcus saxobsidens TaxID=138336 RepID=A0A6L9VXD5_9ACTN|nr:hypothetical protein [Blastococcus saxobsidens]NEK84453.1 hypothetical protein [Blastococcus saxobsidens]
MILGAGLLVLVGLGLFVAALLTGVDALYWGCVAACALAAGLLVAARRGMSARSGSPAGAGGGTTTPAASTPTATVPAGPAARGGATAAGAQGPSAASVAETRDARPATVQVPSGGGGAVARDETDPEIEEVEVTDLLLVVDLTDEVLVVDEHPRYHVAGCAWLGDRETIPIPLDEARGDGFTPCAVCRPDRTLADRARSRR